MWRQLDRTAETQGEHAVRMGRIEENLNPVAEIHVKYQAERTIERPSEEAGGQAEEGGEETKS